MYSAEMVPWMHVRHHLDKHNRPKTIQYNKEQIIKNENVHVLLFLKVFMYFVLQHYSAATSTFSL